MLSANNSRDLNSRSSIRGGGSTHKAGIRSSSSNTNSQRNINGGDLSKHIKMTKEEREENLKAKVRELNDLTEIFVARVREVMGAKKIFGWVFVYDGMDYIKVVSNEMNQIR